MADPVNPSEMTLTIFNVASYQTSAGHHLNKESRRV